MGKIRLKEIALLQFAVMIYTLSGIAAKNAAFYEPLSWKFLLFYGLEIAVLGVYAILWQQMIKKFDLSVAYANRSMAILWSMLWAVLFFGEAITMKNIIGVIIVLAGTMLINGDED